MIRILLWNQFIEPQCTCSVTSPLLNRMGTVWHQNRNLFPWHSRCQWLFPDGSGWATRYSAGGWTDGKSTGIQSRGKDEEFGTTDPGLFWLVEWQQNHFGTRITIICFEWNLREQQEWHCWRDVLRNWIYVRCSESLSVNLCSFEPLQRPKCILNLQSISFVESNQRSVLWIIGEIDDRSTSRGETAPVQWSLEQSSGWIGGRGTVTHWQDIQIASKSMDGNGNIAAGIWGVETEQWNLQRWVDWSGGYWID